MRVIDIEEEMGMRDLDVYYTNELTTLISGESNEK